uniref:Immunoglobulin V-set domain-containing protein n=1 Tax=Astyanax mexicanus TaxID=7994 RepID=W5KHC7_ASTMX
MKYLCRGRCSSWEVKDVPVRSGPGPKDQRFSLEDDPGAGVFTVTITDLRSEDAGMYWCGVERPGRVDVYTMIRLRVQTDDLIPTTPVQTKPTYLSPYPSAGLIVLYVCIPLLLSGITISAVIFYCKWRKTGGIQNSAILQRAARPDGGAIDHEYKPPGRQNHVAVISVYQSLNFNTNQSDSAYQTLHVNSNQSDSAYQTLNVKSNQSNSGYQTLNVKSNQSNSGYQTLNVKSNQLVSGYQNLKVNINQSDSAYQTLIVNSNQSDSAYQTLNVKSNQPNSVYQTMNIHINQSN